MFFDNLISKIYSIFKISFNQYPNGSLPKLYRIGNRLLRHAYSDLDGIPFAESVLFSHTDDPAKFQLMDEHVKIYSEYVSIDDILSKDNFLHVFERLDADVFYKLKQIETQKTPHSCVHAAQFMTLNYARSYHSIRTDKQSQRISIKLEGFSKSSGYDDGVGHERLSTILKTLGLFKQSKPANYGLRSQNGNPWPKEVNDLAQYFAYLLFCFGPVSVYVQEPDTSYGHYITLTGIFQTIDGQQPRVVYADPWEGEMFVEPLEKFSQTLTLAAKTFNHNKREFYHVPSPYEASFHRRLIHDAADMKTIFVPTDTPKEINQSEVVGHSSFGLGV